MRLIRLISGSIIIYYLFRFFLGLPFLYKSFLATFGLILPVYVLTAYFLGWAFTRLVSLAGRGLSWLGRLQKFFTWTIAVLAVIYVFAWLSLKTLPPAAEMSPELYRDPIQTATSRHNFTFAYRGNEFEVMPLADYELLGLVVSRNNINNPLNYYHNKDDVNITDICVIWGDNVKSEIYRKIKFSSGEWTCYINWKARGDRQSFKGDQLSNNHLLSDNPEIQEKMRGLRVGDQVRLRGQLVGYKTAGSPDQSYRNSSLVRNDEGNGACEVVFVERLDILKRGLARAYFLKDLSQGLIILFFIIKIVIFFFESRGTKSYGDAIHAN